MHITLAEGADRAVKTLRRSREGGEVACADLLRELTVLSRARHRNVIRLKAHGQRPSLVDPGRLGSVPFGCLELVETTLAKQLQGAEDGVTIFAPSEAAFEALGEKKRAQLKDVRNEETVGQIAAYHCIAEPVTKEKLYDSGGVVTMGNHRAVRTLSHFMYGVGSAGAELFAPPPVPPFTLMASVKLRSRGASLAFTWKRLEIFSRWRPIF